MLYGINPVFRFQTGSIKSKVTGYAPATILRFDSKLVRLKVKITTCQRQILFSFDSKLVRLKVYHESIRF